MAAGGTTGASGHATGHHRGTRTLCKIRGGMLFPDGDDGDDDDDDDVDDDGDGDDGDHGSFLFLSPLFLSCHDRLNIHHLLQMLKILSQNTHYEEIILDQLSL